MHERERARERERGEGRSAEAELDHEGKEQEAFLAANVMRMTRALMDELDPSGRSIGNK